jgi:hypothetical protein
MFCGNRADSDSVDVDGGSAKTLRSEVEPAAPGMMTSTHFPTSGSREGTNLFPTSGAQRRALSPDTHQRVLSNVSGQVVSHHIESLSRQVDDAIAQLTSKIKSPQPPGRTMDSSLLRQIDHDHNYQPRSDTVRDGCASRQEAVGDDDGDDDDVEDGASRPTFNCRGDVETRAGEDGQQSSTSAVEPSGAGHDVLFNSPSVLRHIQREQGVKLNSTIRVTSNKRVLTRSSAPGDGPQSSSSAVETSGAGRDAIFNSHSGQQHVQCEQGVKLHSTQLTSTPVTRRGEGDEWRRADSDVCFRSIKPVFQKRPMDRGTQRGGYTVPQTPAHLTMTEEDGVNTESRAPVTYRGQELVPITVVSSVAEQRHPVNYVEDTTWTTREPLTMSSAAEKYPVSYATGEGTWPPSGQLEKTTWRKASSVPVQFVDRTTLEEDYIRVPVTSRDQELQGEPIVMSSVAEQYPVSYTTVGETARARRGGAAVQGSSGEQPEQVTWRKASSVPVQFVDRTTLEEHHIRVPATSRRQGLVPITVVSSVAEQHHPVNYVEDTTWTTREPLTMSSAAEQYPVSYTTGEGTRLPSEQVEPTTWRKAPSLPVLPMNRTTLEEDYTRVPVTSRDGELQGDRLDRRHVPVAGAGGRVLDNPEDSRRRRSDPVGVRHSFDGNIGRRLEDGVDFLASDGGDFEQQTRNVKRPRGDQLTYTNSPALSRDRSNPPNVSEGPNEGHHSTEYFAHRNRQRTTLADNVRENPVERGHCAEDFSHSRTQRAAAADSVRRNPVERGNCAEDFDYRRNHRATVADNVRDNTDERGSCVEDFDCRGNQCTALADNVSEKHDGRGHRAEDSTHQRRRRATRPDNVRDEPDECGTCVKQFSHNRVAHATRAEDCHRQPDECGVCADGFSTKHNTHEGRIEERAIDRPRSGQSRTSTTARDRSSCATTRAASPDEHHDRVRRTSRSGRQSDEMKSSSRHQPPTGGDGGDDSSDASDGRRGSGRDRHQPNRSRKTSRPNQPPDGGDGGDDSSDNDDDHRRSGRGRDKGSRRNANDQPGSDDSRSRVRQQSRDRAKRWLKPEKFDGRSSFETFLCTFQNCAAYNRWCDADKVAYLRWSLTGIAAQLLWDADDLDYKDLVDKLRSRFGGKGMEERFQTELRCRRRTKGESLRELAQDIRRLMSLAYPGEKSGLVEHIARDAFLTALDDPEFELKIREREPPDLDSASKIAQRYEVSRSIVDATSNGRHRVTRQVLEYEKPSTADLTIFESRMVALESRMQPTSLPVEHGNTDDKDEQRKRNQSCAGENRMRGSRRSRAINQEDPPWRNQLLHKIQELEAEQSQIRAEKDAMSKEIGRLKHLEQVHSDAAARTSKPGAALSTPGRGSSSNFDGSMLELRRARAFCQFVFAEETRSTEVKSTRTARHTTSARRSTQPSGSWNHRRL